MSRLQKLAAVAHRRPSGTIYNHVFWLSYAANLTLVTANALTFRFAELVAYLGGNEADSGKIVGAGVAAALAARVVLGQAIDRFGTRRLWMLSGVLFVAGSGMFLSAADLSWSIFAARVLFAVGLAGMFTCSIVHIQNHVPSERRTEVLATLGTSGFFGMILGTQLGDAIFRSVDSGPTQFAWLFGGAAGLGMLYVLVVIVLTGRDVHAPPRVTPALHRLVIRYWPGTVTLVALMMGVTFNVITVFLTRFATERGLPGIGTFFAAYCISAFTFRMLGRRWSRSMGRAKMILLGLAGQTLGLSLLPGVYEEWQFIVPAIAAGFGHAMLFPAVISLGAGAFPRHFRGTGTTIVLGFTEVGQMISGPLLGGIIDNYGFPVMLWTAAGMAMVVAAVFAVTSLHRHDEDIVRADVASESSTTAPPRSDPAAIEQEDESIRLPFPQIGRNV